MKPDELARVLIDGEPADWPGRLAALRVDHESSADLRAQAAALQTQSIESGPEKKNMKKSILYGLAALVLVAVGAGIYLSQGGGREVPAGIIQIVFGSASLSAGEKKEELTAATVPASGLSFAPGSVLKTGPASAAQLTFLGGIVSRIAENTQVTLMRGKVLGADAADLEVKLEGQLSFRSGALKGGAFAVRTPTAIASVRGTEFHLTGAPALSTLVVYEGQVDLEAGATGSKAQIKAGQRATVDAAGNILVGSLQPGDTILRTQFQRDDEVFRKYGTGPLNTELELGSEEEIKKHYGHLFTVRLLDGREYTGYPSFHGSVLQIHTTYGVIEMDQSAVLSLDELK